jgi:hypothetical protein
VRSISIDISDGLLSILENEARKEQTTVPQLLADRLVYSFVTRPIRMGNRVFTVCVTDMQDEPEIRRDCAFTTQNGEVFP